MKGKPVHLFSMCPSERERPEARVFDGLDEGCRQAELSEALLDASLT
jgi:hypothetical protein